MQTAATPQPTKEHDARGCRHCRLFDACVLDGTLDGKTNVFPEENRPMRVRGW